MSVLKKISIVIPVYNEQKTLPVVLGKLEKADTLGLEKEIIMIDDGSTDTTPKIIKNHQGRYKLLVHQKNRGKGAALRTGFAAATGDIILIQDADNEYNPADYPKLLAPLLDGRADAVYGSRLLDPQADSFQPFTHGFVFGNRLITWAARRITDYKLTDVETAYKVFLAGILPKVELSKDGFEFELEFTSQLAKNKYRLVEVPISYRGRSYAEGRKYRNKARAKDFLFAVQLLARTIL